MSYRQYNYFVKVELSPTKFTITNPDGTKAPEITNITESSKINYTLKDCPTGMTFTSPEFSSTSTLGFSYLDAGLTIVFKDEDTDDDLIGFYLCTQLDGTTYKSKDPQIQDHKVSPPAT